MVPQINATAHAASVTGEPANRGASPAKDAGRGGGGKPDPEERQPRARRARAVEQRERDEDGSGEQRRRPQRRALVGGELRLVLGKRHRQSRLGHPSRDTIRRGRWSKSTPCQARVGLTAPCLRIYCRVFAGLLRVKRGPSRAGRW